MKRSGSKIAIWVIVGIIVILVVVGISQYNSLVGINENVENQRANIDTMLQRRVDLIPNLVNTVKGYAEHEIDDPHILES